MPTPVRFGKGFVCCYTYIHRGRDQERHTYIHIYISELSALSANLPGSISKVQRMFLFLCRMCVLGFTCTSTLFSNESLSADLSEQHVKRDQESVRNSITLGSDVCECVFKRSPFSQGQRIRQELHRHGSVCVCVCERGRLPLFKKTRQGLLQNQGRGSRLGSLVCVSVCVCTYVCMCIYTIMHHASCIHAYNHAYIHTYTHTHTKSITTSPTQST